MAKSTFGSENVQNTAVSEHFLKFRCQKMVRRCGEKHIWKSKCSKTVVLGALLEVQMSENGSLNSKLPTIWRVEKQMRQAVKSEGRRCNSAKVRRKKRHPRQMLEKSRNAVFFP